MLNILWWFVAVEAIGLAAFPLAYYLLPKLSDRGLSLSKPLGILVIAYASWMLSVLHIVPSVRITIAGLFLVLTGLSAWYAWKKRVELKEFVIKEKRTLIAIEAIFVIAFVGWTLFRSFDPYINHTEQPMDYAFLNASIDSVVGQPEDPWLSGNSISYYYFGYWMMGTLTELTSIPSNYTYNLALALIPAMAAAAVFGLAFNIVRLDSGRWKMAVTSGVVAAFLLISVANLEGVLEFARSNGMGSDGFWSWVGIDGLDEPSETLAESWTPNDFWWWFRATRVINTFEDGNGIDYTIQEFPFFSFILGDLHPHVAAIPFVALFLGLMWNFLRSPIFKWTERNIHGYVSVFVIGLVLGGVAFTNMWDLPTYAALFISLAFLKAYRAYEGRIGEVIANVVPIGAAVVGLAFILFLPYFLTFKGGVEGIGAVPTGTRPIHLFLIWGLYLVAVGPFILASFWQTTIRRDWIKTFAISLLIGFMPFVVWVLLQDEGMGELAGRFFKILPFALLISIAVYNIIWIVQEGSETGKLFAMVLSALGLMMIMGPELLFVRDSFGSRMNTVFKLYYQSWLLFAISSGFAFYYWAELWMKLRDRMSARKRNMMAVWAAAFVVLLLGSLYYPPAAVASKSELSNDKITLDGLSFLTNSRPAEYEAIEYLRENAPQEATMIEAVGEWFDNGLISRSTGVATVFNWPGHEVQWRGGSESFEGREGDIETIYQTLDTAEAQNLLGKYSVDYVYVGPRERDKYGEEGIEKFSSFMDEVFNMDDIVIYRLGGS